MGFKVGDKVKVVNTACVYTQYETWIDSYGIAYRSMWVRDAFPDKDKVYTIVAKRKHLFYTDITLCLISDGKQAYIVQQDGLERIKEKDDLELVKDTMTYKEALKACIDGHEVRHKLWPKDCYIYYSHGDFKFNNYNNFNNDRNYTLAQHFNNLDNSSHLLESAWQIYHSQPKFSVGQLVANTQGDYARITKVIEEKDGWSYKLQFNNNQPHNTVRYREEGIRKVE